MPAIEPDRFVGTLHANSNDVFFRAEHLCHSEDERLKIASMVAKLLTIEIDFGKIIHSIEVKGGISLMGLVEEFKSKPDHAVMVKASQEPVLGDEHFIPTRIIIFRLGKIGIIFRTIIPVTRKIHKPSFDQGIRLIGIKC
jgi:hypothetical protein